MNNERKGRTPQNFKALVASEVRRDIFEGRLKPNQKIDQDALAERLGISKLPVREALILLENEGLVENLPRRGCFVASLTPDDISDHYRLIGAVSGLAARRAAELITGETLQTLRGLLDKLAQTDNPAEQEELNFNFHRVINQVGASHRLRSALRLIVNTMPSHFYETTSGWAEHARETHERIYTALSAHDPDASEKAMHDHMTWGAEAAVQNLTDVGFWSNGSAGRA